MYQVFGIRKLFTLFGGLCALIFTVWVATYPPSNMDTLLEWSSRAYRSIACAAFFVTVLGQSPAFPLICRLPFVRDWLPPIDGNWEATLVSNWPAIQQRLDSTAPMLKTQDVKANITITSRFFYIRINLESDNRYSTSKTIFVRAVRDIEDGSTKLYYIYRNSTLTPVDTDSDGHDGAASLKIEKTGENIWLEGLYWTNRNWHKGLNTAGKITLRRAVGS